MAASLSATLAVVAALSTGSVADTVGVNTHLDFNNWGYQNLTQTAADINYLGLRHLRDCPNHPGMWATIATATGAKFLAFIGETSLTGANAQLNNMDALAAAGILEGIDGANEWDAAFSLSQGVNIQTGAIFQQQVFAKGRLLNLPVVNMSFGAGWVPPLYEGDYVKVGDLSPWTDYANAHTYPVSASQSVEFSVNRLNGLAQRAAVGRPVITTEIGFKTDVFSERDQARYTLFTVFDGIRFGNPRSYFYALYDDGSGHFGFHRRDGSRKPSGEALHNLMGLLNDAGPARTDTLTAALVGATAHDQSLVMERSDGTFVIALWDESDAPHPVTLQLGSTAATINVRDPLVGTLVQTASGTNSLMVTIPDYPVIVEVVPATSPPPPPPPPPVQTPAGVSLSVTAVSLDDLTPVGTVISASTVTTSDGLPFTGTETADQPFAVLADGSVAVASALPTGPTSLSPAVTASENGVSASAAMSVTVTHFAPPPPPPPQTPTSVSLSVGSASLDDKTAVGAIVATPTVQTSDGQPFAGLLSVTAPFAISGGNIVLASALPTGPVSLVATVIATENGVSTSVSLSITVTHFVPPPTWNPQWVSPASLTVKAGVVLGPQLGISVTDPLAVGHAGSMALNLAVTKGTISARSSTGALLAGSGTAKISFSGSFAAVNAVLATLTYTAPTSGSGILTLDIWDQGGHEAKKSVAVTVTP